jgi:hypothetical protein
LVFQAVTVGQAVAVIKVMLVEVQLQGKEIVVVAAMVVEFQQAVVVERAVTVHRRLTTKEQVATAVQALTHSQRGLLL